MIGWRRLALAAGLVLLLAGWWSLEALTGSRTERSAVVRRGSLVLGVEVTGTLEAIDSTLIGPPQVKEMWQFKISRMAREGEHVRAGTPVLEFDASELEQRLEQQVAEADAARKQIEKVENELALKRKEDELRYSEAEARRRRARMKVDLPGELAAARDLALARLDLELADKEIASLEAQLAASERSTEATLAAYRNQLNRAENQVNQIRAGIEGMVQRSPREGTVIYVSNWRDEKKKVGDACWRGERVLQVPDLERMKAAGQVHESDAGKVLEGQRVSLRLDAHPDVEFTGRVGSIWRTVQRESWRSPLKVVRLEIALDQTDTLRMRPGMRFRGKIEIDRAEDALLIPAEAVVMTPTGPAALKRSWHGCESVPLELGRRGETDVEVVGGLGEGDSICMSPSSGSDAT